MKDSIATAVGATAPIVIAGREFTASPLSLYDLGEIEQTFRMRVMSAAMNAPAPNTEARDQMYRAAVRETMDISFDDPRVQKFISTPAGALELIAFSLRPKHPSVTARSLGTLLIGRMKELDPIITLIGVISGFKSKEAAGGDNDGKPFPEAVDDEANHGGAGRALRLGSADGATAHAAAG